MVNVYQPQMALRTSDVESQERTIIAPPRNINETAVQSCDIIEIFEILYIYTHIYLDVLSCITLIYSFFSSYWYHRKQRCYDSVWLREFATEEAVQRGAGDGWLDVLPISPCPAPLDQNVVVDVSPLAPRNWLRNTAVKKKWRKSPMAMLQCWIKYGRIW